MSAQPGEREQPRGTGGSTNPRPVWRRAGVWIGGVAAAALATVLAGALTQGFGWFAEVATIHGDPVTVRVDAEPPVDDVVLSPEASLSAEELAQLAALPIEVQVRWLVENEQGDVSGNRKVTLYLTGNRASTVRVTDVSSEESCEPISRGTLVRMIAGRGAGVDSEVVSIDVGQGPSDAYVTDPSGEHHAYFPDRTITLAHGEEVPLVVDLVPDFSGSICRVELDLTVQDGSDERTQRISGPDGPFEVMSIELYEDEIEYGTVYLGGEICRQYVLATPDWNSRPSCGEGNFAQ